jgi:integrase/recombinase XerD
MEREILTACLPERFAARFWRSGGSKGIALNMVQKWLGHAQLTTTAIYANAVGEEEQSIASRMWY